VSDSQNLQPRNSAEVDFLCLGMKAFRDGAPDDKTMPTMWREGWRYGLIAHAKRNPAELTERQRRQVRPKARFNFGRKAA
jgi:hypothetical protein